MHFGHCSFTNDTVAFLNRLLHISSTLLKSYSVRSLLNAIVVRRYVSLCLKVQGKSFVSTMCVIY